MDLEARGRSSLARSIGLVNETLEVMPKAREKPLTGEWQKGAETRRQNRQEENTKLLEMARDTPWEWPEVNVYSDDTTAIALKSPAYRRKTLEGLRLFKELETTNDKSTYIWDFKDKTWVEWAPKENKSLSGQRLWRCAQMVLNVIFFRNHRYDAEDLKDYIPDEFFHQVFLHAEWIKMVKMEEGNTLIIFDFPKPFDSKKDDVDKLSPHFCYFIDQAISDLDATTQFFERLTSCVDWKTICENRIEDEAAYDWGIVSLAVAVDLAYRLGYGVTGRAQTPVSGLSLRLKYKEEAAKKQGPPYNAILLQEDFGKVQKITQGSVPKQAGKRTINTIEREKGFDGIQSSSKKRKRVDGENAKVREEKGKDGNNTSSREAKGQNAESKPKAPRTRFPLAGMYANKQSTTPRTLSKVRQGDASGRITGRTENKTKENQGIESSNFDHLKLADHRDEVKYDPTKGVETQSEEKNKANHVEDVTRLNRNRTEVDDFRQQLDIYDVRDDVPLQKPITSSKFRKPFGRWVMAESKNKTPGRPKIGRANTPTKCMDSVPLLVFDLPRLKAPQEEGDLMVNRRDISADQIKATEKATEQEGDNLMPKKTEDEADSQEIIELESKIGTLSRREANGKINEAEIHDIFHLRKQLRGKKLWLSCARPSRLQETHLSVTADRGENMTRVGEQDIETPRNKLVPFIRGRTGKAKTSKSKDTVQASHLVVV